MRGDRTAAKGRSRSQSPLGALSSDGICHLKRSKRSSSSQRRRSSKLMKNINIDDLPDVVLVEILCRLPCNKFVFQCKCVSKRWRTLISNPYFIHRFLHLQIEKQTPIVGTLISTKGEEVLTIMSSPLFKRLMSFHGLKEEPVVVGTYNDLVLCCATKYYQRDYYICNPYTTQWVALPPAPTQWKRAVAVGFICDIPYYNYKEDKDQKGYIVQVNAEYRCKVVRILPPDQYCEKYHSFILKVEIFSFETGQWRESVVSSPLSFKLVNPQISHSCDGMLYWAGEVSGILIGLDPFMINIDNTSTSISNGDGIIDYYKCLLVDELNVAIPESYWSTAVIECLGVSGGCVRMCDFVNSQESLTLFVWELKEEQDHDHMVVHGTSKLCVKHMRVYSLDQNMLPDDDDDDDDGLFELVAFDPINEDILYLNIDRDIAICNIRTRKWSKLPPLKSKIDCGDYFFPLVLPWWPTPVPGLPQHPCSSAIAHGGGTSS